ncbi:hypothetical protein EB796_024441 [Bugula neritina]|uniref:Uncharacterized protein n=1 Tax=Bugula neritina TaxID=10212 RepID=A0A7J7ITL2_BUGNE|nr:hypothetical protein EB796_024441 [Bugula neritina]
MAGNIERLQAREAARNVINSKIAKALLDDNKFPESQLKINVNKIESDEKRCEAFYKHQQRLFKQQGLINNYEPTIVVERPPALTNLEDNVQKEAVIPHYMKGLSKSKYQNLNCQEPKVDAFKIRCKQKRNLWENKYSDENLNEKFRSIVLHSPPLTKGEQDDLDKGWLVYR